jgi:hypothetical protein
MYYGKCRMVSLLFIYRSFCPSQHYAPWKSTTWCASVGGVMRVSAPHLRKSTCFWSTKTWVIGLETEHIVFLSWNQYLDVFFICPQNKTIDISSWYSDSTILLLKLSEWSNSYLIILWQLSMEVFGWNIECKTRMPIVDFSNDMDTDWYTLL